MAMHFDMLQELVYIAILLFHKLLQLSFNPI